MSRWINVETRTDVEIDLYDIIEDIAEVYHSDGNFRRELDKELKSADMVEGLLSRQELIYLLKKARKDVILWDRIKPDLEEMMKDDYVVVM